MHQLAALEEVQLEDVKNHTNSISSCKVVEVLSPCAFLYLAHLCSLAPCEPCHLVI